MDSRSGSEEPSKARGRYGVGRGEVADASPDLQLFPLSLVRSAAVEGACASRAMPRSPGDGRHLWELPAEVAVLAIATLLSPAQLRGALRESDGGCEGACLVTEALFACRGPCPLAEALESLMSGSARAAITHVRTHPMIVLAEYWQRAHHDLSASNLACFYWALTTDPRWELTTLRERVGRELSVRALRAVGGWTDLDAQR